jgi:hypothetical protein
VARKKNYILPNGNGSKSLTVTNAMKITNNPNLKGNNYRQMMLNQLNMLDKQKSSNVSLSLPEHYDAKPGSVITKTRPPSKK